MNQEVKKFKERFDPTTKEIMVLTGEGMSAGKCGGAEYWNVSIPILAYIDMKTGELVEGKRCVEWLATDEQCQSAEKIHNLQGQTIYQLTVRESLPFMNEYIDESMDRGRWLMLVDVIDRKCHDSRLEGILKDYQREVFIEVDGCEKLILDKSLDLFSGDGIWNGEECCINLDSDGDGLETADLALETLQELMTNCQTWDQKAREYAANELTDLANDWAEEDDIEITNEDFRKRLEISEVCASPDGDFELFYDDGDMFYGHVIIVSGNIEDGFDSADIAG